MTDRELLELAAEAAGYEINISKDWHDKDQIYLNNIPWNPLTDDGDALRLAIRLKIDLEFHVNVEATAWGRRACGEQRHVTKGDGISPKETRLAIVRAAADIGKNL